MHLARLETFRLETHPASDWLFPSRTWLLVACWTEDGRYGVGEASQSRDDRATEAALRGFEKGIVGLRPEQVMSRLRVHLADANRDRARSAALGALEQAMWDLLGKECALPVTALLGGAMRDAVRLYANIGYAIPAPTAEAYAAAAEAAIADGFTAVKIYPFGMRPPASANHRETRDWLERGVERVAAVRSRVGGEPLLLIDLMYEMPSVSVAADACKRMAAYDPYWIEDPFPTQEIEALLALRRRVDITVAGGTPLLRATDFLALLQSHAVDIVMPDVQWIGGMREAQLVADFAGAYGADVSLHSASGPVACLASGAVSMCAARATLLEYPWSSADWRGSLCRNTEVIEDGYLRATSRPGLGIDIDFDMARELANDSNSTRDSTHAALEHDLLARKVMRT